MSWIKFRGFGELKKEEHIELYSDDLKAVNTKEKESVAPKKVDFITKKASQHSEILKKHSWNMFKYSY